MVEVVLRVSTARFPRRKPVRRDTTKPPLVVVSERKKQLLETRKNADVYKKLWRAHEKGFSVSPRRSVGEILFDSRGSENLLSPAPSLHSLDSYNTEFFRTSSEGIFRCTALSPNAGAGVGVLQKRAFLNYGRGIVNSEGVESSGIPSIARATEVVGSYSEDVSEVCYPNSLQASQKKSTRSIVSSEGNECSGPFITRAAEVIGSYSEDVSDVGEPDALQASQNKLNVISSVMVARLSRVSKLTDDSLVCTVAYLDKTDSKCPKAQLKRNFSDDDISTVVRDSDFEKSLDKTTEEDIIPPTNSKVDDDKKETRDLNGSDCEENAEEQIDRYNAWDVLKSEYAEGYGGENFHSFRILGTSADDTSAQPHVLSPPLMESLQYFLPYVASEHNFWMKFSLLRDGANLHTMMQMIRGAKYTIIAVETVRGEVFGSFTGTPWKKQHRFFGSNEAFLWRMRKTRDTPCHSIIDQAKLESELEVFPWTGHNYHTQLYQHDRIAVGSEMIDSAESDDPDMYGFGLAIDKDLLTGTSSPCITFGNPCLCKHSKNGNFQIANLEVWTLSPCMTKQQAEKLEFKKNLLRDEQPKLKLSGI